jgi:hypothetical protein
MHHTIHFISRGAVSVHGFQSVLSGYPGHFAQKHLVDHKIFVIWTNNPRQFLNVLKQNTKKKIHPVLLHSTTIIYLLIPVPIAVAVGVESVLVDFTHDATFQRNFNNVTPIFENILPQSASLHYRIQLSVKIIQIITLFVGQANLFELLAKLDYFGFLFQQQFPHANRA